MNERMNERTTHLEWLLNAHVATHYARWIHEARPPRGFYVLDVVLYIRIPKVYV